MKMKKTKTKQILELARKSKIISAAEMKKLGIHSEYLRRLCAVGKLVQIERGLYSPANVDMTEHHGLAQISKAIPKGVICLLSALRFYNIGTQAPYEVWIAINRRDAYPRIKHLRIRVFYYSGKSLTEGIEEHIIEGVSVRIYNPAKTIADCFKYRNKIGLEVALEALREALRMHKCTTDELWKYAKICRVSKVMLPYMEALV
jgi:predicted transcriptional regulator of viral defense system